MEGHHQILSRLALPISTVDFIEAWRRAGIIFRFSSVAIDIQQGKDAVAAIQFNKGDKQDDMLSFKAHEDPGV